MSFHPAITGLLAILIAMELLAGCMEQANYAPVIINNEVTVIDAGSADPKNRADAQQPSLIQPGTADAKASFAQKNHSSATAEGENKPVKKSFTPIDGTKTKPASRNPTLKPSVAKIAIKQEKKSIISTDNKKMLKLFFDWPIKGRISKNFNQSNKKGIDIAGKIGQKVRAAEAGKIAYSGEGLLGFGNLIIIKHNDLYLSAYGNNSRLLVKEGEQVKKGQVIAQVGKALSKKAALHFEIRKNGKPVNPLKLLPKSDKTL